MADSSWSWCCAVTVAATGSHGASAPRPLRSTPVPQSVASPRSRQSLSLAMPVEEVSDSPESVTGSAGLGHEIEITESSGGEAPGRSVCKTGHVHVSSGGVPGLCTGIASVAATGSAATTASGSGPADAQVGWDSETGLGPCQWMKEFVSAAEARQTALLVQMAAMVDALACQCRVRCSTCSCECHRSVRVSCTAGGSSCDGPTGVGGADSDMSESAPVPPKV